MPYKNKEDRKQYDKQYQLRNKEKIKGYKKQYCEKNKEKIKKYKEQWDIKNKEKQKQYMKQWYISHKEHRNEYYRQYQNKKRRADLKYNLNRRMSCAIWKTLKSNKAGRYWESLVGYTVEDLKKRLQSTMPEGYTWQDYMDGKLHIDHRIPIAAHNFDNSNQIDFRNCWALNNLQLLPAEENLIKGAKLEQPFQPSLKMAI